MSLKNILKQIITAFSFLTKIPLNFINITEEDFKKSLKFFPLVGVFEGFISSLLILTLIKIFPAEVLALLNLILLYLIRGIFHLDGLADTFDALNVKSTEDKAKDIEKRLSVMKDSTTGVAGVWVIAINLLCKYIFIKKIIEINMFLPALVLTYTSSRWSTLLASFKAKTTKTSSLGTLIIKNNSFKEFLFSVFLVISVYLLIGFLFFKINFLIAIFLLGNLFLTSFITLTLRLYFQRKFSGITGDNLGAIIEIIEIVLLFYWGYLWQKL